MGQTQLLPETFCILSSLINFLTCSDRVQSPEVAKMLDNCTCASAFFGSSVIIFSATFLPRIVSP
ncbi:hypothetical protein Hanom_Chr14g01248441 [Helianthus anomalus]